MDSFASALQAYVQGLKDIQVTRYAQLTSSCIIVFDHLLTFDEEVDLIWKSAWSLGKVLFLLNRYYPLAASIFNNYALFSPTLTDAICLRFFHWQGWTGLISCMLAEGILQIRLYALYSLDKRVLALMLTSFVLCSTLSAFVMGSVLTSITASAYPVPGGKFCVPKGVSTHFYAFWIPMLSFETLLCTLAVIRAIQMYQPSRSVFHSGRQLVSVLVRDSLMYFLVIFATYLTCLLVWTLAPVNLLGVPIGFSVAMSCVLANRVVLNVREISRDINLSKQPIIMSPKAEVDSDLPYHRSIRSPGALSPLEMEELRTMRAKSPRREVIEYYNESELPFRVL
ncbi:hypothetical protein M413DRAFT_448053 [Hebeloma cylindrosporum]|uniref:DUF6533 domain-containing protein n=1 Tax=Hebeloma cylindrosporum TaxID=76867 RepID=A0A0C3BMU5_HEBCY|nr:hypothetical protein M413DRAFT_448053 [Hebeloma cylindrosporum h7]